MTATPVETPMALKTGLARHEYWVLGGDLASLSPGCRRTFLRLSF